MSLDTWKSEFYPIEASKVPVEEAVQHSLRKWRGLTKENLEKHGVIKDEDSTKIMYGKGGMSIDAHSCALCEHYLDSYQMDNACEGCPLVTVRGVPCDDDSESSVSPYHEFTGKGNPLPMIAALEKAAALEPSIK